MKWSWDGNSAKIYLWTDRFSSSNGRQILFQTHSPSVLKENMDNNFLKWIPQAVRIDDVNLFFETDSPSCSNGRQFFGNGYPEPFKRIPNPFKNSKTFFKHRVPVIRGTQRQFSKNICSEDDLRSRIFRTFVVKFLACLPLLGFWNI